MADATEAESAVVSQGSWLNRNVLALGLVSLLTDSATEMVIPLLPLFLTTVLGAGPMALGLIEGVADAVASVLKFLSGRWSDRAGRRRPFVLAGYSLSSLCRPFVALAGTTWHVLVVRVLDRTGKGLRSSPRDALLAASVAPAQRGAAFGLHRAMDHAGAVLGPLIAFSILTWWTDDLRTIFWWSAIPGALAVLMILVFVKESTPESPLPEPVLRDAGTNTGSGLATLLLPIGLFTIGNSSDLFLLLKASASRSPMTELPLLWMGLHLVKTIASVPGGRLADTLGRRKVLALGWIYYAAVYTAFAFVDDPRLIWCLFIAYGIHHGLTEGAERALVAELAPASQRGTAFGWFHLTVGIGSLVASVMFGTVWTYAGSRAAFLMSATLAILAAGTLIGLTPPSDGVRQEITGDSDG